MTEHPDVKRAYLAEELLGPLNPQERLYAPKQLFVAGHVEWLRQERRVRAGGRLGFIVPSGLYCEFDIDSRFKFNPVIVVKGGKTESIRTAFMRRISEIVELLEPAEAEGQRSGLKFSGARKIWPISHMRLRKSVRLLTLFRLIRVLFLQNCRKNLTTFGTLSKRVTPSGG